MKRIISLLLAAVMCLSLAACGGNNPAGSAAAAENPFKDAAVGDEIVFGHYNGDLVWTVLDVQEDHAVVLCNSAVAPKKNDSVGSKWHTSGMLANLNLLAKYMFTDEQKALTMNPILDGEESKGYMFLLSSEEVEQYMPGEDNELRLATVPEAVIDAGVEAYENAMGTAAYCNWILRDGAWVGGQIGNAGQIINTTEQKYDYAIRPAMWVRLP